MIIKEWFCSEHGDFEGSHAICPALGCESAEVIRVFHTAPGMKSDNTKRFDDGVRRSAELYQQSDYRSAKAGESSKANNQAASVLWGSNAQDFLAKGGRDITTAHQPASYNITDKEGKKSTWTDHGGMRTVANEVGITKNRLPAAERIIPTNDQEMRKKIMQS